MSITYDELTRLGEEARTGQLESVPASTVEAMVDFYENCLDDRNGWKETWARTQRAKIDLQRERDTKNKKVETFLADHTDLPVEVRTFLEELTVNET